MIAQKPRSAPASPMEAPTVKPSRRPMRFISSDAGTVATIVITNWMPMGSVASTLVSASWCPIRAAAATTADIEVRKSAWQVARSATSRAPERVMAHDSTSCRRPADATALKADCTAPGGAQTAALDTLVGHITFQI